MLVIVSSCVADGVTSLGGKLGNSGASAAPHLHFQIMNGPDFLTARGLPCYFSNIVNFLGKKISLIQDNLTIVHTVDS
ncbi:MAG: hypothetical protein EAX95_13810 [Candidatus Thorarchaeota archaeon]|nr:hypothetical protein [Candidatus Thorarchaeota archaeon]